MKLLLFLLLFTTLVLSPVKQDKITAYRFIEKHDDGPCSIVTCINSEEYKDDIAKSTSKDALLTDKLIDFREETTKGVSLPFHCSNKWISGDIIDAIIVLHGKINDTLFFSEKRDLLVIPKQNKAYSYSRKEFIKILNPKMSIFFSREFETERYKLILGKE